MAKIQEVRVCGFFARLELLEVGLRFSLPFWTIFAKKSKRVCCCGAIEMLQKRENERKNEAEKARTTKK